MSNETLLNAIVGINLKDIESISIDNYVKKALEIGAIKSKKEIIAHIEKDVLNPLIDLEEYEKCAWLKIRLDGLKTKYNKK